MGLKINRQNNLEKLFDKFAIGPDDKVEKAKKEKDKKKSTAKDEKKA